MKKVVVILFASGLMVSCSYDFNIDELGVVYTPKPVVYCVFTPEESFELHLSWSKKNETNNTFEVIGGAEIEIYEDDILWSTGLTDINGLFVAGFHAVAGSNYRLQIYVPDYGYLKAETYVPDILPSGQASFIETRYNEYDDIYYHHFELSGIEIPGNNHNIWIYARYRYERDILNYTPWYYYPSTMALDQVNLFLNNTDIEYTGSNIECERFLRIPSGLISGMSPFDVSFTAKPFKTGFIVDPITGNQKKETDIIEEVHFDFICPSPEYDKYFRSAYKQEASKYGDNYIFDGAFSDQNVYVENNIENGLGVFAGYLKHTATLSGYPQYFRDKFGDHPD